MDLMKRLFRRPFSTVVWLLVLSIMASMLGVGANLLHASDSLAENLDQYHTTIAVRSVDMEGTDADGYRDYTPLQQEELDRLLSLDMVEMVDLRTLTGAYIPSLTSQLGLVKWGTLCAQDYDMHNHTTNESYNQVVLVGTIEDAWAVPYDSMCDLSALGGGERVKPHYTVAVLNIEQIVSAHPDYDFFPTEEFSEYCGKVYVTASVLSQTDEPIFKQGQRYIVSGMYDPSCHGREMLGLATPDGVFYPWINVSSRYCLNGTECIPEKDALIVYRNAVQRYMDLSTQGDMGLSVYQSASDPIPVAQEMEDALEDFLAENPAWQEVINLSEQAQHCFPVLGTECLETMHCFLTNTASMTQGRSFTQEEYDTGARVCVISESVALTGNIQVGDIITLNQYLCDTQDNTNRSLCLEGWPDDKLNNPALGQRLIPEGFATEGEAFTVVGIYRLERSWDDSTFSITPNTVFMPQKAQIPGGFGGCSHMEEKLISGYRVDLETGEQTFFEEMKDMLKTAGVFGVYFSVKLQNGTMDEFHQTLEDLGIRDNYITLDQGYDNAKESLIPVAEQARKLFLMASVGWALLLALYLLLYQNRQHGNLGIMRSLGATPGQARRYLFGSGMTLAALGVLIGTFASGQITRLVSGQLTDFLLGADTMGAFSGGQELRSEEILTMVTGGQLPLNRLLLLAGIQLVVIALLLWLQAYLLARKRPRKLMSM